MTVPRKGARRIADIPPAILEQLNQGLIPTSTYVEWLALDIRQLVRALIPQLDLTNTSYAVSLTQASDEIAPRGIIARTLEMGHAFYDILYTHPHAADLWARMARHPSDVVRYWANVALLAAPALTLTERIEHSRRFAIDDHWNVREIAWFALRPYIQAEPAATVRLFEPWARDPHPYIRRFPVEATRPRGVMTYHLTAFKHNPDLALPLLDPLKNESVRYIQLSVANWLNDAAKTQPAWAVKVTNRWLVESPTPATRWIVNHALRWLRRQSD